MRIPLGKNPKLITLNLQRTFPILVNIDVLIGRGASISKFPGNILFRQLLNEQREQYTSRCRRRLKNDIAEQIIIQINQRGGRFLREVIISEDDDGEFLELSHNTKRWMIVDKKSVKAKIKEALREIKNPSVDAHASGTFATDGQQQTIIDEMTNSLIDLQGILSSSNRNAPFLDLN
jgi:hypothetical protein